MNAMRRDARSTRRGATWRSGTQQELVVAEEVTPTPQISDMDTIVMEAESDQMMEDMDASVAKKKPWEKGGVKIKKKKVPGAKNLRIRKYVQPKNAVMCLNELQPGLNYVTEVERGVSMPVCVSVEVEGQKYKGFGSSKTLAKQAAAEAALISFVKPPTQSGDVTDDKTPWATLASFAIYKLFNEWREGRVGVMTSAAQAMINMSTDVGFPQPATATAPVLPAVAPSLVANMGSSETQEGTHPKPAKSLPENASGIHPSVVLHQMRPSVVYNIEITTINDQKHFVASAVIDGQQFTGEGVKVKKAKFQLAKEAIKVLFGVDSTFQMAA